MDAKKALNIIAGQCSKKEYCSFDVMTKLARWELAEKDIAAIMEFLVKNRFVDDLRFAEAYARDKHRFNRWGKLKIGQMLRQKHIADTIIDELWLLCRRSRAIRSVCLYCSKRIKA